MYIYLFVLGISWIIGLIAAGILLGRVYKVPQIKKFLSERPIKTLLTLIIGAIAIGSFGYKTYPPHFAMPPWMSNFAPHRMGPELPLLNAAKFLFQSQSFPRVDNIAADPNARHSTHRTRGHFRNCPRNLLQLLDLQ